MKRKTTQCDKCGAINRVSQESNIGVPFCGKCQSKLEISKDAKSISGKNLEKIIRNSELPVIVDVFADWCGPCKLYAPIFQQVAQQNFKRAEFFKLDSEKNPEFSTKFNIRGIPTTLVFKNGVLIESRSGMLNSTMLNELLPRE